MWIPPENIRAGSVFPPGRNAAGIMEVLREHDLEHAAVGVLGLDLVPPWHPNPIMPYTLWRAVLDQLPGVTFRQVGQSFMFATKCLSDEEQVLERLGAVAASR
jgi:hypothetical protein